MEQIIEPKSDLTSSFRRTGPFPLEEKYIFCNENELRQWAELPENYAILHKGLFKIVVNPGSGSDKPDDQTLYWVCKKQTNSDVEFRPLISWNSIESLETKIDDEIGSSLEALRNSITAIWGTSDVENIDEKLNSILKLSEAIAALRSLTGQMKESMIDLSHTDQALAGTNQTDVISYLQTLDYGSITQLSKRLHGFLDEQGTGSKMIDTWPDLTAFLAGFSDTETLKGYLDDLVDQIHLDFWGDKPSPEYDSLKKIEDIIKTMKVYIQTKDTQLQQEIDETQLGCGLNQDGTYMADPTTYYIQSARSIVNALKILDEAIYMIASANNVEFKDSSTITVERDELKTSVRFTPTVKVSEAKTDNCIEIEKDGLYHSVDFVVEDGDMKFYVNGHLTRCYHTGENIVTFESIKYDPSTEDLVFTYKKASGSFGEVRVPMHDMIREWTVDNLASSPISLSYTVAIGDGKDKLSADLKLSREAGNILVVKNGELYASVDPTNILVDGETLNSVISKLFKAIDDEIKQREADIQSLTESNKEIKESFDALTTKTDNSIVSLRNEIVSTVNTFKTEVNTDINNLHSEFREDMDNLRSTLNSRIDSIDESVTSRLDSMQNTLNSQLESFKNSYEQRISNLESTVNSAVAELAKAVNEHKESVNASLTEHMKLIRVNEDNIERIQATLQQLKEEVTNNRSDFDSHIQNKENPHEVTNDQVNAYSKEYINALHSWKKPDGTLEGNHPLEYSGV